MSVRLSTWLAMTAVAGAAAWFWLGGGLRPGDSSAEVAALMAALDTMATRPVEARLSLGISYRPVAVQQRGTGSSGASPDLRIAAARIELVAGDRPAPGVLAALGISQLTQGLWTDAIATFEDLVERQPRDAKALSDLSAAYLARASAEDRSEDWIRALSAARQATALATDDGAAQFNRALALQRLHLPIEAAAAWKRYLEIDRSSPWRGEAQQRFEETSARAQRPPTTDWQSVRERIEDELLPQWGSEFEHGNVAAADRLLAEAGERAAVLAGSGGETLPQLAVATIQRETLAGRRQSLMPLARAHRLYGEAQQKIRGGAETDAVALLEEAAKGFAAFDSPYRHTAAIWAAIQLRNRGQAGAGLLRIRSIQGTRLPASFHFLRGRAFWIEGLIQESLGRWDAARDLMRRATEEFRDAEERDNLIATETNLAEAEWYLGNRQAAWARVLAVLSQIEDNGPTRRFGYLDLGARMAVTSSHAAAAIDFHDAHVRAAGGLASSHADALVRRARTLVGAGELTLAAADVERAVAMLPDVTDATLRQRLTVELEITRSEVLARSDCASALARIDAVLPSLATTGATLRRSALRTTEARCRRALGDQPGAEAALLEAQALFEARRDTIVTAADRIQAFDAEREAFGELIALEVDRDHHDAALHVAERSRSGALSAAWNVGASPWPEQARLPPGSAIVYYHVLRDRLLTWVLVGDQRTLLTRPISERDLARDVARLRHAIAAGASLHAIRATAAPFIDAVVGPAMAIASQQLQTPDGKTPRLIVVPDGPLFGVPFAALPDESGRPLLERFVVSVGQSFRTSMAASRRLDAFAPTDVMAVGDGHDVQATGLPRLARADAEAAEVGRIYPRQTVLTGTAATKRHLLVARPRVMHFAGHSLLNPTFPMFSRLLLAPEGDAGDPGALFASEITAADFGQTDVVMLASCDGAAGETVAGEGAISLARAFFAAGVPAVAASLWAVDDDLQLLARTFHTALRDDRDPARALRTAQRAVLAERGPATPVRVWGGFVLIGGLI